MEHQEYFDDADFVSAAPPAKGDGQPPALMSAAPPAVNAMTSVDQSRAVAEVQAALVIAKSQPRSEIQAEHKIIEACKRMGLALTAIYSYKRGSEQVEGPSIRLAETMARYWGNMNYGFREISRDGGASEIEAYAWDLETNTKAVRQFQMKHWRDTKKGGYEVTQERDKYELMANFAQRRVRACILEIIPGDIVETAMEQCNRTLKGNSDVPLIDRIKKMVIAFEEIGVSAAMIEARVQHSIDSINIHEYRQLGKLFNAIKDGYSTVDELFDSAPAASEPPKEPKANGKKKAAQTQAEAPPADDKAPDAEITHETLKAIEAELSRLGVPDRLPPDIVDEYGTADPSELTEPQGRQALIYLKGLKV